MTLQRDLDRIAEQERRLVLPRFDESTAWQLGTSLKDACEARGAAATIEVRLAGQTVFLHAMRGTTPANADWARRKRNTVELLHRSSYAIGLQLQADGTSLEQKMGLPPRDYASHGGSFPIRVAGCGCVGAVTVSGLPQRDDHALVVVALAALAGIVPAELAFD